MESLNSPESIHSLHFEIWILKFTAAGCEGAPYLFKLQGRQNVNSSLVVGNKPPAKARDGKIREIREAVSMSIVGMEPNAKLVYVRRTKQLFRTNTDPFEKA